MTNSPLFSITIYNPENGRSTDYDLAYLKTEAKMQARRAGGKYLAHRLEIVEHRNITRLKTDYLTPGGHVATVSSAL